MLRMALAVLLGGAAPYALRCHGAPVRTINDADGALRSIRRLVKNGVRHVYWSVYGPSIRTPEFPEAPRSFLFVCKGNICRSPFAERLALKLGREMGVGDLMVASAGLHVRDPLPPPKAACRAAEKFGIGLEGHRSRGVSLDQVASYDVVVAMEAWQLIALRRLFSGSNGKMFLLPLFEQSRQGYFRYNIQDPYGGSDLGFTTCFEEIARCLRSLLRMTSRVPDMALGSAPNWLPRSDHDAT